MNREQKDVLDWHRKFGVLVNIEPTDIDLETKLLRYQLIHEELQELYDAQKTGNLVTVADALGDLLYVVYGTAVSYGLDMEPIFAEIHRSNMSKGDPEVIRASNGKILKSRGWSPPNLKDIIEFKGNQS